jgi:hypothetical protein
MESILTSTKKLLGIDESDTTFDVDIIFHINSVFMALNQLGVGPSKGFSIEDDTAVWTDFVDPSANLEAVKSYVHHKVRIMFDPPDRSSILQAMNETIKELEWRLNVGAESNHSE